MQVREGVLRAKLEAERTKDTNHHINFDETIKNLGESIRHIKKIHLLDKY